MPGALSLPTLQNWSCHSCGNCCRHHQILVTDAERQRILDQKWTDADGVPAGEGAFERAGGGRFRLAHKGDGACVFLDENNRCRIHAKFGEAAKPLACRVYPFVFHPTGERSFAVGLRYDCPSAAGNKGAPLKEQRRDLETLRDLVVPAEGGEGRKAPPVSAKERLDWDDTMRIVRRLRAIVCDADDVVTLPTRLVHALFVADMLGKATFDKVRGERLDELLNTLAWAAPHETVASAGQLEEPSGLAKAQFRLIVAQYAVRDTLGQSGMGYRLGKALAGFKMARGKGRTPDVQDGMGHVPFAELEQPFDGGKPAIERLMERYFDVKLSGMGFCGIGCHGMQVVEGFQDLALLYPVTMYLARWMARGRGETTVAVADVERAVAVVDHHHGRSPAMAMGNFRNRVRWLAYRGEVGKLIGWYGR
jgi:lysine-N-methylase